MRASVVFSEEVLLEPLLDGDITVDIDGPLKPYEFEFIVKESTGYNENISTKILFVQFDFKSSLLGNNKGKFNN